MEDVIIHRDIKLVTRERRRNYLVPERTFYTKKFFTENILAIEIKKTEILMNKPVYLGLSILELSIILIYEFLYDYVKPKYGEKAKLCHIDTDKFIAYIKIDYIYQEMAEDVETRFDNSTYKLPKGKK